MSFASFKTAAMPVVQIMSEYSRLQPQMRANRLQGDDLTLFHALSDALKKRLTLDIVTANPDNGDLHAQLAGHDQVHDHGARTPEELRVYRLGNFDCNKTALALINPNGANGGREVLCAIYIYWQNDGGGPIHDPRLLRGNVANILRQRIFPDASDTTQAAVFYSISTFNVLKGAGQMLIERMHEALVQKTNPDLTLATLSPLRHFGTWLADMRGTSHLMDNARQTDVTLRAAALEFLLHNRDGVQMFHMGNGATIGDINLHANNSDSKDFVLGHNVMVNYLYSRDPAELAVNRNRHAHACLAQRDGKVDEARAIILGMMAPHLREEIAGTRHLPSYRPGEPGCAP